MKKAHLPSFGDLPLALKAMGVARGLTRSARPLVHRVTEGSAGEAADVRLESFGLSIGLSAAAESAFPEGAIA